MVSNIKICVLEQVAYIIYVCHLDVLHFISKILLHNFMFYIAQSAYNCHLDCILQPLQFSLLPIIQ